MLSDAADMAKIKPIPDMSIFMVWFLAPLIYRKAGLIQTGPTGSPGAMCRMSSGGKVPGRPPDPDAPSFAKVANTPGTTSAALIAHYGRRMRPCQTSSSGPVT